MAVEKRHFTCEYCKRDHEIEVDTALFTPLQLQGKERIRLNFICPEMAVMYRAMAYAFDFTVNNLKDPFPNDDVKNTLKAKWGVEDFDNKLARFIELDIAYMSMPDEYHRLLQQIITSYCCGNFYPAMTGAGALGERILNKLILKTRQHFKSSPLYKSVYRQDSFDKWEMPVNVLKTWGIISEDVANLFLSLKKYRNDSIHYNEGYNFESNSYEAIKLVATIIDKQLNYLNRKDLFWVTDLPGEIWLRSSALADPFVQEFILPYCMPLGPFCEPLGEPPIIRKNVPRKPLNDEEFIQMRKTRRPHL